MEKDMNRKIKKYGVLKNSLFMLQAAKDHVPSVIWLAVLDALLAVAVSVTTLYVAPSILHSLEIHSTLPELLYTILFFTMGITAVSAVHAYVHLRMRRLRVHRPHRLPYLLSCAVP